MTSDEECDGASLGRMLTAKLRQCGGSTTLTTVEEAEGVAETLEHSIRQYSVTKRTKKTHMFRAATHLAHGSLVAAGTVAVAVVASVSPTDARRPSSISTPAGVNNPRGVRVPPVAFADFHGSQYRISWAVNALYVSAARALLSWIGG
eukprot:6198983-Pleurochrysis_carterae.AAC.3